MLDAPTTFHGLDELTAILNKQKTRPFLDNHVIWDPFNHQVEIGFGRLEGHTTIDGEGKERPLYTRLLIENVASFDVEFFDSEADRLLFRQLEPLDDQTYRFVTNASRWLLRFNGDMTGSIGEAVDDTDVEITLPIGIVFAGVAVLVLLMTAVVWWLL